MTSNAKATPIKDFVFVEMDAFQEKLKFKNGGELYLAAWMDPEAHATVEATVHSVGALSTLGLQAGDIVAVDYKLAADYEIVGETRIHRRAHYIGGKIVWKADNRMILGVKRDGEWQAVGNWCFLESIPDTPVVSSSLIIPESVGKKVKEGEGRVLSGSDAPVGSIALFQEDYRSEYVLPDATRIIVMPVDFILAYKKDAA